MLSQWVRCPFYRQSTMAKLSAERGAPSVTRWINVYAESTTSSHEQDLGLRDMSKVSKPTRSQSTFQDTNRLPCRRCPKLRGRRLPAVSTTSCSHGSRPACWRPYATTLLRAYHDFTNWRSFRISYRPRGHQRPQQAPWLDYFGQDPGKDDFNGIETAAAD